MLLLAFAALLLPTSWMAAAHEWLGLGELPQSPVIEYLTRSIAALYGFHGVLVMIVAGDPMRYRTIVSYLGVMDIVFGLLMLAIDLHAGMPSMWTIGEGPSLVVMGTLTLIALSRVQHADLT